MIDPFQAMFDAMCVEGVRIFYKEYELVGIEICPNKEEFLLAWDSNNVRCKINQKLEVLYDPLLNW